VVLAVAGLFAQLVVVQRLRPTARAMLAAGLPLMLIAFLLFVVGQNLPTFLVGLAALGLGGGLVRPGTSAGASLSVSADEQGAVAGVMGGLAVVGNIVGPMVGTSLYAMRPGAPYVMNAVVTGLALGVALTSNRIRGLRG
jgi:MFS family permease